MANLTLTAHQYAERRGIPEDEALKELHSLIDATTVSLAADTWRGEPRFVVPDTELRTYNE